MLFSTNLNFSLYSKHIMYNFGVRTAGLTSSCLSENSGQHKVDDKGVQQLSLL
jgi:hypothetical protein